MAAPILPEAAFGPLRVMQEKGLRHRGFVERSVTIRLPNGEEETGWQVVEANIPVLLVPAGVDEAAQAEAQGIKARWVLKQRLTGSILPGDRVVVTGRSGGQAFQE